MTHSDLLKYAILTENSDYGHLTSRQLHELLEEAEEGADFGDFYHEMEMDSPVVEFWRGKGFLEEAESLHSHNFYEILFCTQGKVQYLLGTTRCFIENGDFMVIPPGISHCRLFHARKPYVRYGMWVNASRMREFEQEFSGFSFPKEESHVVHIQGVLWDELEGYFSRGWQATREQGPLWEAEAYGQAVMLLIKMCQALGEPSGTMVSEREPDLLDNLLAYVESNLANKITLLDTAHRFFVSESHITHLFQKKMRSSFYRYVTQRRLIAAKNRIERGQALEQVGEEVGFASYSNFYRAFVKEYGISPSRYRDMYLK